MSSQTQSRGQRELAINVTLNGIDGHSTPHSPYESTPKPPTTQQVKSLEDAWEDAKKRFQGSTSKSLDVAPIDMDRFLEDWAARYDDDDSEKGRKKKKILAVVENMLDGINVVGSVIASGVSTTFGLAGPCFNALSFLLTIPRRISSVYESLLTLFEEVENFLVRFKILRRIEGMKRLPAEMLINASKMLFSFVDICGLAYKLLNGHRLPTALSAIFLCKDSGVSAALDNFRRMALSLDSLTNTISLENILDVQETGRETNMISRDTNVISRDTNLISRDTNAMVSEGNVVVKESAMLLRSLEQTSIDDKTKRVNQSRLTNIQERIYGRGERAVEKPFDFQEDLLPETSSILDGCEPFCQWRDAPHKSGRSAFLLRGPSGSGKSRVMEALKKSLDDLRQSASKEEISIYVAYHMFTGRINKEKPTLIPAALRAMAVQVAEQSTVYAKELDDILTTKKSILISQMETIHELWDALRLSTFKTKTQQATMYLLFDGVENENAGPVNQLVELFAGNKAERAGTQDTLSVRAIFATDTKSQINPSIPSIDMTTATRDLVRTYATKSLRKLGLFQSHDKKSTRRRKMIMDAVRIASEGTDESLEAWTFKNVKDRLDRISLAVQNDELSNELTEILQYEGGQTIDPKARQALKDLERRLTPREIAQINEMLPWLLYSEYCFCLELDELEAVLFLAHNSDSLQNLSTKIKGKFSDLFDWGTYITLKDEKAMVLQENDEEPSQVSESKEALISLDISIKNVERPVVQQFLWQLNEKIGSGKFEFETSVTAGQNKISANRLEGHLSIVKTCLKLLNEGWREETAVLVRYSRSFLASHFRYLADHFSNISRANRQMISHDLVSLLAEPYHLSCDNDRHFGGAEEWATNPDNSKAIIQWLTNTKDEMQARDRRWVQEALKPENGPLGYLKTYAHAVGKKWAHHNKENATERISTWFSEVRRSNALEISLFQWLDTYMDHMIATETEAEADAEADTKDDEADPANATNSGQADHDGEAALSDESKQDNVEEANTEQHEGTPAGSIESADDHIDTVQDGVQTSEPAQDPAQQQVVDENATESDAINNNAINGDDTNDDATNNDTTNNDTTNNDTTNNDATNNDTTNNDTTNNDTTNNDATNIDANVDANKDDAINNDATDNDATKNDATSNDLEKGDNVEMDDATGKDTEPDEEPPSTVLSMGQKIDRVITWLHKEEVASLEKPVAYLNFGYTYLWFGEYDAAEKYFTKAMLTDQYKRQGLVALARLFYAQDRKEEAAANMQEALSIFAEKKARKGLTSDEDEILAELYCELATMHEQAEEPKLDSTIELYKNALQCKDDLEVRWKVLKLQCQADQAKSTNEAIALLDKWLDQTDDSGCEGVALAFMRSGFHASAWEALREFIHAIRDETLRTEVIKELSAAANNEDTLRNPQSRVKLLYLQGLAVARGISENRWAVAVDLWEEVLDTVVEEGGSEAQDDMMLSWAYAGIAQYQFDLCMATLTKDAQAGLSAQEKAAKVETLRSILNIKAAGNPALPRYRVDAMTDRLLVSAYMALGDVDEARKLSTIEMTTVLDVLSDDDGDNDLMGISSLVAIMCSMDDRVGALTAFSLLDRKLPEAPASPVRSPTPKTPRTDETSPSTDEPTKSPNIIASYSYYCTACRDEFTSADPKGLWWCQSCDDFNLCNPCYDQIYSGALSLHCCNRDHKLMRLRHVEYDEEEIAGENVKIDWEWEDLGDGLFNRKGGRIVPLSEWLAELRTKWNIPESSKNDRAQK